MTRGLTAVLIGMAVIGINAAMPYVAAIMSAPVVPLLVRRISLLDMPLLSGAIDVVAILAFTLTDNVWAWLVLRYLVGFGMLFHWVNAAVTDKTAVRLSARTVRCFPPACSADRSCSASWVPKAACRSSQAPA